MSSGLKGSGLKDLSRVARQSLLEAMGQNQMKWSPAKENTSCGRDTGHLSGEGQVLRGGQLTEVLLQPHAMRSISLRTTESLNKMRAQVNISTLKPHADLAVLETTALHVSLILITVRAAQLG